MSLRLALALALLLLLAAVPPRSTRYTASTHLVSHTHMLCMCMCMRLSLSGFRGGYIRASPSYTPGSSSASSSPNPTAPPCTSAQPRRSGSTATGRRERTYKQKKKNCGKSTGRRAGASAPKSRSNNCGKSSTGRTGRRALAHLKTETKRVEKGNA